MDSRNLAVGIMLLSQSTVGILGNLSLLSSYVILYYSGCTLKLTDLILTHLFLANFLTILSKGIPQAMVAFGLKHFIDNFGCKLILYVYRVSRSMSIGTTCLLSVFQAITISPGNSCLKTLKVKAPKYIGLSIYLCWILYMMVNMIFPVYEHAKRNSKNKTEKRDFEFCYISREKIADALYVALIVFPEVFFSLLIAWSSGSMIVILYRHKQRVRYICSSQVSHRTSPESRATQSILAVVSTFLAFYTLSSMLQGWISLSYGPSWWLRNIGTIISLCFPTLGPFLMDCNFTVSRFFFSWLRNTKSQDLIGV